MAQPYKKRKRDGSSHQPMAIDRPIRKSWRKSTSESKWFDTNLSSATAIASSGTITSTSINLVDEGNGVNQMAGRKIVVTRIQVRCLITTTPDSNASLTAFAQAPAYRFMVVLDRQCNGATTTVASIFETSDIRSFNNLSNSRRYKVLKEISDSLPTPLAFNSNTLVYAAGENRKECSMYIKCNLPIMYTEQAGGSRVIGEVVSNNILILGFSTDGNCKVQYRTRIRFNDN